MFAHVFKFNPYRDGKGRFAPKDSRDGAAQDKPKEGLMDSDAPLSNYFKKFDDPEVTPKKVMTHLTPEERGEIAAYVIKAQSAPTSKSLFSKDGKYTADRRALHKQIMREVLTEAAIKAATPKDGEAPSFVVLGGRGGSGKSSFTNGKVDEFDGDKYLVLDSDAIKAKLRPPYKGWNAFSVHEESADIFDQLTHVAKRLKLNIVHDATLKSNSVEKTIVEMKKDGYDVEGHYMFVPRQTSAKRALSRYLGRDGKRGRLVPVDVILQNTENEKNFDNLKKYFSKWSAYDNQGAEPVLINRSKKKEKAK